MVLGVAGRQFYSLATATGCLVRRLGSAHRQRVQTAVKSSRRVEPDPRSQLSDPLGERQGQSGALKQLLSLHDNRVVRVHVGIMSASENVRGGGEPTHPAFAEWVQRLGLTQLPTVQPQWRLGMTGLNGQVLAADDNLPVRVRRIVHPSATDTYDQFATAAGLDPTGPIHRKWRNRICDIDAMVAHIRARNDVFVTEDKHFLDHADDLAALGARHVLTPEEAVNHVRALR